MKKLKKGFSLLVVFTSSIFAQENSILEFSKIWDKIQTHSHTQKALVLESKAALQSKQKAAKHWYPRVYVDARAYNTNDPAMNFFSILGQRSAR